MSDVAALAGVSLKTVSRHVNGEPGVSIATAGRVEAAIKLLDFQLNTVASVLARADGRTGSIGLLLDDIANPFSAQLFRAIEDTCAERDTIVLAGSSDKRHDRERQLLEEFARRRVDGLIVVPLHEGAGVQAEARYGTAVVFLDRPGNLSRADSVATNNREASYEAVRQLIELGHRRIAFLGDLDGIWTEHERYAGYLEALRADRVPVDPDLIVRAVHDSSRAEQDTADLLDLARPPTAFFAWQNRATMGVWRALRARSLTHERALIGFDDFELADVLDPPVTVIVQDPSALGSTAATLLLDRLAGDTAPPRHVIVPSRLVRRGSGEIPASAA